MSDDTLPIVILLPIGILYLHIMIHYVPDIAHGCNTMLWRLQSREQLFDSVNSYWCSGLCLFVCFYYFFYLLLLFFLNQVSESCSDVVQSHIAI